MNSREKGCRGEREWAAFLRQLGVDGARRGQQYQGSPGSPDVVGVPGTHCEVKRVERLRLWEALDQAVRDAGDSVPYVAHRANRREWVVILRAADLPRFARCIIEGLRE